MPTLTGPIVAFTGIAEESFFRRNQQQEPVPVCTLDELCARRQIERCDLIKIDVEGAEVPVLQGAARLLREHRIRVVHIDSSTAVAHGDSPAAVQQIIIDHGYVRDPMLNPAWYTLPEDAA